MKEEYCKNLASYNIYVALLLNCEVAHYFTGLFPKSSLVLS